MKITYLHQYFKFPNETGGTRSFDLSNGFLKIGHDVDIITSTSSEEMKSKNRWFKLKKRGIKVNYIYLPYSNKMAYFNRVIVFLKFAWFSSFKLLSLKTDIVLATSTPLTIGIPALIKKWFHKTPYIFEVRDLWPEAPIAVGVIKNKFFKKILFWLEYLIYKNSSAIIPLSVDMKYSIISRYPKLKKKITVIENISEMERFQKKHNKKKSFLKNKIGFKPRFSILYAGTFGHVNGIDYVIRMAHEMIKLDPTIVFILVGDGKEKNKIMQEAIKKRLINKNIFFLNPISKKDLPKLYFECDMASSFVIPIKELWANSANKFFDTLAAGKPILINYKGWQQKVINKANIGYVLPLNIKKTLVKKFIAYTRNKLLILKQGKNAKYFAKENYALNIALTKYNSVLSTLKIN
jgi:glycosyltransferase involved in cell wall biosynthesis